jgi:glycine/D-amino acid oxidase-like deaminating enzyme
MAPRGDHEVVIVGAGVAGAVAARALAADHDILLVDRSGVASAATGRSAGLVAPTLFYGDTPPVARYANAFFREFDGTDQFRLTRRDRVDLVTDPEADDARATARQRREAGFPVEFLDADTLSARYPRFRAGSFAGAVEYRDTGWVDPYSYTMALVSAARHRGATVETDVRMTGLATERGQVTGVETEAGPIGADAVVVAAGWRTPDLVAEHVSLPVRPYRTQCLTLSPSEPLGEEFPLVRVGSDHLYMRPEHTGNLLVGGGRELPEDPEAASRSDDESFRRTVAARVPDIVSGFHRAGVVNGWAGVDGATPDALPIIDEPETGPDGLVVATGFNGLGVMLSPVVGPAVRQLLGTEQAPFALETFTLSRFEHRSPSFALQSTSDL